MAKNRIRKLGRKALSLLLTLTVVTSLMQVSAFATENEENSQLMAGSFVMDANGIVDTTDETSVVDEESGFTLTKSIQQTGVNQFDITLQVVTSQVVTASSAAVQLVIDASNSMSDCGECDGGYGHRNSHRTRLQVMKDILAGSDGFLESLAEANTGKIHVSVVSFGSDAETECGWVDIKTEAGMEAVKDAINDLGTTALATNTHAGLMLARNRLGMEEVENAGVKFAVLLSDGQANCTGIEDDSTEKIRLEGWGPSGPQGTTAGRNGAAAMVKALYDMDTEVYAVGYGVEESYLQGIVGQYGSVLAGEDAETISSVFGTIASSTVEGINGAGSTVTDPMGEFIVLGDVSGLSGEGVAEDENGFVWNLDPANAEKAFAGDKTTYTYTLTYPITLDTSAEGFVEGEYYPTNGYTYLNAVLEDGETKEIAFLVPGVWGEIPDKELSVTKVWDAQGAEVEIPESVMVQLYKDGEPEGEPVTLSEENQWSCFWSALDGVNDWTVEELNVPEGWEAAYSVDGSNVTITNSYLNIGTLVITKNVEGVDAIPVETTFVIAGPDGYSKTVTYAEFVDGQYVLNDLPLGLYTVSENSDTARVEGYALTIEGSDAEVELVDAEAAEIVITNTYEEIYIPVHTPGSVTVTKVSSGAETPASALFQLQKLVGGEWVNVGEAVSYAAFTDGTYVFSNLSEGSYRVEESGAEIVGYELTTVNEDVAVLEESISDLGDTSVSFGDIRITNTYDALLGYLTINKTVECLPAGAQIPATTRFDIVNFHASPTDGVNPVVKSVYWSEFENNSITVELPVGHYTVVEDLGSAKVDGYTVKRVAVYANELYADVTLNAEAVVEYTNIYEEIYVPQSELSVTKEADVETAKAGDVITYTITVTNTGDAAANEVVIVDTPDRNLTIGEISNGGVYENGKITWNVATLPAGVAWSATVKATVKNTDAVQVYNSVTAADAAGNSDSDDATVVLKASLTISKKIKGLDARSESALERVLSFTVTDPNGESVEYEYSSFRNGKLKIDDPIPGVYTVKENNAEVTGYILDNGSGEWEVEVGEGGRAVTLNINNNYTGKIYNIWFDGGNHGDVRNDLGNPVAGVWRNLWTEIQTEESYFDWSGFSLKEGWKVYQKGIDDTNNLYDDLAENHQIPEGTSVVLYHFTWAQWLDYQNEMSESKPGLSVESEWKSDREFYLNGGETAFTSFEDAVNYMNSSVTPDANGFYNAYYVAKYENDPTPPPAPPSGGDTPDPDPVPDPDPAPVPVIEIPEEDVPLADEPLVEIPEEEVPLADVPKTGDDLLLYMILASVSGLGLLGLAKSLRKREEILE